VVATLSIEPLFSNEVRLDPYAYYAELHKHGPVCRLDADGRQYQFLVTGYDACSEVLRGHDFMVMDDTLAAGKPSWEENRTRAIFFNSMMFTNSPRQPRMRHLFSRTFTPRRIEAMEPVIEQIAGRLLDRLAERAGPVDLMGEYAFPLPASVLGRLLGVPDEDLPWYRERAAALSKVIELGGGTAENYRKSDEASTDLTDYFAKMVADRRANPGDDLISALVQAQDEDPGLVSERELLSNLVIVFNAGFVTTVHLMGNGLTILLERPEHLARLRQEPARAPAYIDEILRLEGPTHFVARFAATDTEVARVPVPAGSGVLVLLSAANRDPSRFADPDSFDPDRPVTSHLAFSIGAHYCMGAALARIEGQLGLTKLLQRFPSLSLAEEPPPPRQLMLRGHDRLLINLS
jgi:cytochrome P450